MTIREPVQVLEIDVPYCTRTYGSAPCAAALGTTGAAKCFNTYATCQDKANYDAGTNTLRFATSINGLLKSETLYPAMLGEVSGSPLEISVSPTDTRLGPLGRRETLSVRIRDFQDNDTQLDKYQAERVSGAALASGVGYSPEARGTFWGRLLARWPYWKDAPARVLDGYVGEPLSAFTKRHFIISTITGPGSDGTVTVGLKDVLDLVSEDRLVPEPSDGRLSVDIDDTFIGSFDVTPAGVGADYATSGRICIGSEVMTYTRSGDTFTIVQRAVDGTEAGSHSEGDTVQECYRVESGKKNEVLEDLLVTYAKVSAGFIPSADWQSESDVWFASLRLTRTITKPTPVIEVVSSLLTLGAFIWWDRETQKIKFRANRPKTPTETLPEFVGRDDFIDGTFSKEELPDRRITDVVFFHKILDPTKSAEDGENYAKSLVASDNAASGANEHGKRTFLTIFSPWLGDGDDNIARSIAFRLLYRFRETPVRLSAVLDIDRAADVAIASPVKVQVRSLQSADGSDEPRQFQVMKTQKDKNNRISVEFETYEFAGRFGYITENTRGDYGSSSATEIENGTYLVDGGTLLFPDGTGPYVLF